MNKLALLFALIFSSITHAWTIDGVGDFKFEQASDRVYVMHGPIASPNEQNYGFMNNPIFIEGDNGLIVIDPGSSKFVGDNILKEVKKISSKPVVAVINTHVHGDHWLANHAIKDKYPDAKFYAHMNMIREAEYGEAQRWIKTYSDITDKAKGTIAVIPTYSIGHKDTLTIEGQKFIIHSPLPSSHSSSDIMIEHVNSKTLFTGDNAFTDRMGRFDGQSNMLDNIKILDYAKNLTIDTYVPGHGYSGAVTQAIDPYLNYLKIIEQESRKGYEEDLADYEIKPFADKHLAEYRDWSGYDEQLGKHINKMLLEIEALDL
ncbi:MAG: MBL fold metallo-hydrolase [Candidatus Thioglobus sp.]|nr:MBL fold metallo-hydrolase [Candidatus Thioglobus pontius]MBL6976723.1 MBL fold metallo-hydrolase [Candidatus Thioglobus sp.]MBL6984365.1 MBL fold metallo-hydrolase [Candidatus Thioglobus sp.]